MVSRIDPLARGSAGRSTAFEASKATAWHLVTVCTVAAVGGIGYLGISARFDYAAHFLSGAGGTLILIAALTVTVSIIQRRKPVRAGTIQALLVSVTFVSIGIGFLTEYFLFGDPAADWLDIVHQSLGAGFIGLISVLLFDTAAPAVTVYVQSAANAVIGLVFIGMGAYLVGLV